MNSKSKITTLKGLAAKAVLAAMAAGAFLVASPAKAEAQGFAVGARVGSPSSDRRETFEFERRRAVLRHEQFERREALLRRERFERFHGRPGDR
jgi:hypothetical protein